MELSEELDFTREEIYRLRSTKYGNGWPVVYIIYNEEEAYVGETVDVVARLMQHYNSPHRRKLKNMRIIYDEKFNKSVVLDLESHLITHMVADTRFKKLQNGNAGHQLHNYYDREVYEAKFPKLWHDLQKVGLAKRQLKAIEDTNLFKFSPYKTLNNDQHLVVNNILHGMVGDASKSRQGTYIVNGWTGTGKTVLAIYLMKLLTTNIGIDLDEEIGSGDESLIKDLLKLSQLIPRPKIGLVVPMANLRKALKDVFKATYGLSASMVISPSAVANHAGKFDILLVDEAHRLKAPRNMMGTELANMRKNNVRLGLGKDTGTQLDWILKKSRYQVLFYDEFQTIKRTDVDKTRFKKLAKHASVFDLDTQMRCGKGGREYVKYIRDLFSDEPPKQFINFKDKSRKLDYDFEIFDNPQQMVNTIRAKDAKDGLCRSVAGYAWPWKTNGKIHPKNAEQTTACIANGNYDIKIADNKFIWNTSRSGWVGTANSANEIGCIHTIQGFDLNYTGVIIGNDLKYDAVNKRLYIDRDQYFDVNGKNKTSDAELREYILHIYAVLCSRGISGTYVYACDPALRQYLKKYIKVAR